MTGTVPESQMCVPRPGQMYADHLRKLICSLCIRVLDFLREFCLVCGVVGYMFFMLCLFGIIQDDNDDDADDDNDDDDYKEEEDNSCSGLHVRMI